MDTIGYFVNHTNTVAKNNESVILLSSTTLSGLGGFYIPKDSILKVSIVFTARKLITGKYHTWLNNNDNYLVPSILLEDKEV